MPEEDSAAVQAIRPTGSAGVVFAGHAHYPCPEAIATGGVGRRIGRTGIGLRGPSSPNSIADAAWARPCSVRGVAKPRGSDACQSSWRVGNLVVELGTRQDPCRVGLARDGGVEIGLPGLRIRRVLRTEVPKSLAVPGDPCLLRKPRDASLMARRPSLPVAYGFGSRSAPNSPWISASP